MNGFFLELYKNIWNNIHVLKNDYILDLNIREKNKESTYCKNVLNSEASKFSTAIGSWLVKLFDVCPILWK